MCSCIGLKETLQFAYMYLLIYINHIYIDLNICVYIDDEERAVLKELRAQPENLYKIINEIFDEFWLMEFEDNVVNAFLARYLYLYIFIRVCVFV
jgi:hypothetical protein